MTVCSVNVGTSKEVTKTMTTGDHVIADIFCVYCRTKLGWKYVPVSFIL